MEESFLHYVWKHKLFKKHILTTTDGETIEIHRPGQHNTDSGPDFFNAQIKIGKTKWAGNVEIHRKSSDWTKHLHQNDEAYRNVILHVVFEHDSEVFSQSATKIPTLELKNYFDKNAYETYLSLVTNKSWIPCQERISAVDKLTVDIWLDRMVIERLEEKTTSILRDLLLNKNNWEETFYQYLARNFGFNINALPFEMLSKSLPLKYLAKHKNNLTQLEALLFGQGGLLEKKLKDDYSKELKKEYLFLQKKYSLMPINGSLWKFLRLRPVNFPTIRISQFANLIQHSASLFSKILEEESLNNLHSLFETTVSDYWQEHFTFDKPSRRQNKQLGRSSSSLLILNTVIPFLFAYGKHFKSEVHKERALNWLEKMPPENNAIIRRWDELGIGAVSTANSQALLQLKNNYCTKKKCLFCAVGHKILNEYH